MIKVGDIVYKRRKAGTLMSARPVTDSVGLVIKEVREKFAIPQFFVQFDNEAPKWYYQHDLHQISG